MLSENWADSLNNQDPFKLNIYPSLTSMIKDYSLTTID